MNSVKPKLLCLETGGTIACQESPEGLKPSLSFRLMTEQYVPWVRAFAELLIPERGSAEHFGPLIDSTNACCGHWERLAALVQRQTAAGVSGVVITHGTDTLAYAAAAAALLLPRPDVPVVLTGSMLPFTEAGSDAPKNFSDALYAAACLEPAVYTVFNGEIFDPTRMRKHSSQAKRAFRAVGGAAIGQVDWQSKTCQLRRPPIVMPPFVLQADRAPPEFDESVKAVHLVPGFRAQWLIDDLRRADVHGMVVHGFGLGGVPAALINPLRKERCEKPLVLLSQCAEGGVDLTRYEVGRQAAELSLLSGGVLTAAFATIAMMWILRRTRELRRIAELWRELRACF